jgi:RNA polymerase sigma-70 factor (ECF subfamily)
MRWWTDVPTEEQELVVRCRAGDESACREFVDRYQALVYGVCMRILGDRHEAEDVAQEVFLRALRNLDRWDPSRPLRPWLLTITTNRCRTHLGRRRRRAAEGTCLENVPDRRESEHDAAELRTAIYTALEQLRASYRQVFLLFHEQGLGYDEIACLLNRPVGTLKTWLHRARKELLAILRRRGYVPEAKRELSGVSGRAG